MKKFLSNPVAYFFTSVFLYAVGGIFFSTLLFLIAFWIIEAKSLHMPFTADALFWYFMMTSGLGLIVYPIRGLPIAIIVSLISILRPSKFIPLITLFVSAGVLYYFLRFMIAFNVRDQILYACGIIGYTIASIFIQCFLPFRRLKTEQDAAANP